MAVNFFKRVTPSELKTFIPFNRNTRGTSGRAVYINPALLPRYIELINSKSSNQLRLDAAIQGLRALAGGFTSDSNNNNAFCHRTQVDGVEISYSILQDPGPTRKTGVYVTDLKVKANQSNAFSAGLHHANVVNGRWVPNLSTTNTPITYNGVIASGTSTQHGEATVFEAANESGRCLAEKNGKKQMNYDLFFTPESRIDHYGMWTTATQKRLPSGSLAVSLASVMRNIERANKSNFVTWQVNEQGAQTLLQALKLLPSTGLTKLTKQQFTFRNPYVPIPSLKLALHNIGYELTPAMIEMTNSSRSKFAHQIHSREVGLAFKGEKSRLSNSDLISKAPKVSAGKEGTLIFSEIAKRTNSGIAQGWI